MCRVAMGCIALLLSFGHLQPLRAQDAPRTSVVFYSYGPGTLVDVLFASQVVRIADHYDDHDKLSYLRDLPEKIIKPRDKKYSKAKALARWRRHSPIEIVSGEVSYDSDGELTLLTTINMGLGEAPREHLFTLRIDRRNPTQLGVRDLDPTAVALLYALAMDAKEKNLDEKQAVLPLLEHALEQAYITPRGPVSSDFCPVVQRIQEQLALIDDSWKNREGTIEGCR